MARLLGAPPYFIDILPRRVCLAYLSSNPGISLNASSCSNIFSINSSEAREAISVINSDTNHWIKVGEKTSDYKGRFKLNIVSR